jgi:hypothetical protein
MKAITDTKKLLSQYWLAFKQYLKINNSKLVSNNMHNTWCNFALGTSRGTLETVINTKGSNRVELRIHGKHATETYRYLEMKYKEDANKLSSKLIWDPMPGCILKRVYVEQGADIYAEEDWQRQFEWLKKNLEAFYSYFQPKLKAL